MLCWLYCNDWVLVSCHEYVPSHLTSNLANWYRSGHYHIELSIYRWHTSLSGIYFFIFQPFIYRGTSQKPKCRNYMITYPAFGFCLILSTSLPVCIITHFMYNAVRNIWIFLTWITYEYRECNKIQFEWMMLGSNAGLSSILINIFHSVTGLHNKASYV